MGNSTPKTRNRRRRTNARRYDDDRDDDDVRTTTTRERRERRDDDDDDDAMIGAPRCGIFHILNIPHARGAIGDDRTKGYGCAVRVRGEMRARCDDG